MARRLSVRRAEVTPDDSPRLSAAPPPASPPAAALAVPCSVNTLDLTNNMVGGATAAALASFLCDPRARLCRLCLDSNRLGDGAGVTLAEGVGLNATLRALSLRRCNLGLRTGGALGRALGRTAALLHLHLEYNLVQVRARA